LRDLKHGALNFYINAYITPIRCAVWLEFCDRGSLKDIIKAYSQKREQFPDGKKPHMPEKWLWHCFIGLTDALAYLRTGLHFVNEGIKDPNKKDPKWIPILHRDIKPDNILLKSRTLSGERKYFYCVLSDFGLAVHEVPKGHKKYDNSHAQGMMCGTGLWLAPELCHHPWTRNTEQYFPDHQGHTEYSDLWALGTIIFCMAECSEKAHFYPERRQACPPGYDWAFSRSMLKQSRNIKAYYSDFLRESVMRAACWNKKERPTAQRLVIDMSELVKQKFPDSEPRHDEMLPDWSYKKHDFHARPVMKADELVQKR
jgi:serine/threonine protein kinase